MAECTIAQHEYDSAYTNFETEVRLLQEHRQRFEHAEPPGHAFSWRIRRFSNIAHLPFPLHDATPTYGMRVAYADLERRREHYFAAVTHQLQRDLASWESARQDKNREAQKRLMATITEDWRQRGKPLLCNIWNREFELSALDVQTAFLTAQFSYLFDEKHRAGQIYDHVTAFPHKACFRQMFDTSVQDDYNIQAALQHKTTIDEQLLSVRAQIWDELDKRLNVPRGLQTYLDGMELFLRDEIYAAQLSQTQGDLIERGIREAQAYHNLSIFMHEQAQAANERATKLLVDIKAIITIENRAHAADPSSDPSPITNDYLRVAEKRAFDASVCLSQAQADSDLTAAALRSAHELAIPRNLPKPRIKLKPSTANKRRPPPSRPTTTTTTLTIPEWLRSLDVIFSDYTTIVTFPEPPPFPPPLPTFHATLPPPPTATTTKRCHCSSKTPSRALNVCDCAIRAAFASLDLQALKRERTRWHPDKWSCCPRDRREGFERKAAEMFVVLDGMYRGLKG